jgi:hypothetical protein
MLAEVLSIVTAAGAFVGPSSLAGSGLTVGSSEGDG